MVGKVPDVQAGELEFGSLVPTKKQVIVHFLTSVLPVQGSGGATDGSLELIGHSTYLDQ